MDLEVRKKERGVDAERYGCVPFVSSPGFNPGWWDDPGLYGDGSICFEARLGGVEVARARLEETVDLSAYTTAPTLGDAVLQIEFFEVAEGRRGEGIGRELINRLVVMYPNRRLVALSQNAGADKFWGKLGWRRHEHPEEPDWHPLYVQPAQRFPG
ncbi:GNAT family N-acetyltransferase [Jiangella ureilytica]|uniref:GNAT family N-acetyltransferase n=1 Tax=Jiangella ureilytica TaxID=2530374 RepID=A0A4V2XVY0_9ACTN|nr:GNAT family N-acetyltransferase [Jiangella ureilytica]TDC47085.1 GNAT family N-acetyltransferase [Jiangella ureilytica]